MKTEKTDVLVIGAGPAGAVAASLVHKGGYKVKVVEKLKFPRFVIGESLLPRCMEALDEAGFLEALEKRGYQKKYGAKFVCQGKICDFFFKDQFTKGWSWTWQVPRADFDKVLADTLQSQGVSVTYGVSVTGIQWNEDGSSVTTLEDDNGEISRVEAKFIIDGSGYGRVIPRLLHLDKPSNLPPRKTLFTHINDKKRFMDSEPDRITIVVHEQQVWVWIIPFSNGITSLGFVSSPEFFEKFQGEPEQQLREAIASEPYIATRMQDTDFIFEPRMLQSWSATTEKFYGNGFVLTGNATEFLDPVFSSGVTLAVVSSQLAAHLVIRQLNGESVDWEKEYTQKLMKGVNTFRSYVMAWYDGTLQTIFFSDRQDEDIKKMICSVLAGYVWDENNPYVAEHTTALNKLAKKIKLWQKMNAGNNHFNLQ